MRHVSARRDDGDGQSGGSLPKKDRRAARGRRGEWWAELYLRIHGYRVIARRYRTPFAELDRVALAGDALVIIEVKSRRLGGEFRVSREQRRRLHRAALWLESEWLRSNRRRPLPSAPSPSIRVELVTVEWHSGWPPWPRIQREPLEVFDEQPLWRGE